MSLIKEDYVLGNKKIIVGDKSHELVLESLGKIYIKQGSGYKDFSSILNSISSSSENPDNNVIEPTGIKSPEAYKSGQFIFDASTKILYFKYDNELIPLIQYNEESKGDYVSKKGDTMKGQLEITTEASPLKVSSKKLNENFNAEYIGGKKLENLTQKEENETISGNWEFKKDINFETININKELTSKGITNLQDQVNITGLSNFNKTATFSDQKGVAIKVDLGNIITNGNIQSENFKEEESGWKIDSETNTLFIDNVIVKDVLKVLNNAIEKSSGTNGSMWVADNFEIEEKQRVIYLTREECEQIDLTQTSIDNIFYENNYYILVSDELNTHTIPDTSGHPYATRDKQDPQGEEIPEFDFPKWGFKILNKESFIHLFDPVMEQDEESEESEEDDVEDGEEYENDFADGSLHISLLDLFDDNILQQIQSIELFHPFQKNDTEQIFNGQIINQEGIETLTNQIFQTVSSERTQINDDGKYIYQDDAISNINLYYKYFGSNLEKGLNLYIIKLVSNNSQLKIGDIIKCQKTLNNKSMTKQYNALVVGNVLGNYIVQLENSTSTPEQVNYIYNDEGNLIGGETKISDKFQIWSAEVIEQAKTLLSQYPNYKHSSSVKETVHYCIQILLENEQEYYEDFLLDDTTIETDEQKIQIILELSREEISYEEILSNESFNNDFWNYTKVYPEIKDKLIKIGNIYSEESEDSICITSEELGGSYQDILSGINRPDYNVSYLIPSEEIYGDYHIANILNNSKVRLGNLSGIHDYTFKTHQPKSNGLYGRDVYLEGDFRLENGRSMKDIDDDVNEIKSEIEQLDPNSNKCFPILQGKIFLQHDDVRYYNGDGETQTSSLSYYNFDGISYLNLGEPSSMEEFGGFFINQNIFRSTPQRLNNPINEDELSNVGGLVNKIGEDIYLINACEASVENEETFDENLNESYTTYYYSDSLPDNKMHGKLLLGFGERWNTLFEQYGFNIYINITGGYTKTYGDSDITPDEETTSYDEKPLTVQINIIKNEQNSYQSYNSNTNKSIYESDVKFSYYAQLDLYEITGNRSNGDFYIQIMLMPQNS